MPTAAIHRNSDDDGSTPIYLAEDSDFREAGRAIGISLLGVEPEGPAIFFSDSGNFGHDWRIWLTDRFEKNLSAPFISIYLATGKMRNGRIATMDAAIDSMLLPEEKERSLISAGPFFESIADVKKIPQWIRFTGKFDRGETPGHVTTLFALRSALFHLPLLPALVSYVYFEWKSAARSCGSFSPDELTPAQFHNGFPESLETVRRVFESSAGGLASI